MELWAGKAIECLKFGELVCRSLEGKNAENSTEDGGLAYDVSKQSKDSTAHFV